MFKGVELKVFKMTTTMDELIEEANRLQYVASKVNETLSWDLPEIYMVGAQVNFIYFPYFYIDAFTHL